MMLSVPFDQVAMLPPEIQVMAGYSIHPPFIGHVDGRHPLKAAETPAHQEFSRKLEEGPSSTGWVQIAGVWALSCMVRRSFGPGSLVPRWRCQAVMNTPGNRIMADQRSTSPGPAFSSSKASVCEQQTWMTTPTRGEGCRTLVVVRVQDSGIHNAVKLHVALGICIVCSTRHTRGEGLESCHGSRHGGELDCFCDPEHGKLIRGLTSSTQQPRYVVCKISGKPHLGFRTQTRFKSLDPVWHEWIDLEGLELGDTMHFKVFSQEDKKDHEFLGDAKIVARALGLLRFATTTMQIARQGSRALSGTGILDLKSMGEGGEVGGQALPDCICLSVARHCDCRCEVTPAGWDGGVTLMLRGRKARFRVLQFTGFRATGVL
ncbi:unnamed protein product [Symbiodinium sp. CCMP2456]|nr:unnamed protein product [Symbiodinium sp. CCMP2456]